MKRSEKGDEAVCVQVEVGTFTLVLSSFVYFFQFSNFGKQKFFFYCCCYKLHFQTYLVVLAAYKNVSFVFKTHPHAQLKRGDMFLNTKKDAKFIYFFV